MAAIQALKGGKLVWATIALSLATFMQVLDSTIANVAIPTIAGDLGVSVTQGTWVITSFGVSNAISIAISGYLAKRFGEVRVFLWATALFTVFSFTCGVSDSLEMLIIFRVLQGAVAGPVIPLSQSLILRCYPPKMQNMALALWSMTIILAPVFGPIFGGYISDNFHWGWIFFMNIPLGIFVVLVGGYILKGMESTVTKVPFNVIGLALLSVGVGCLQVLLDKGKELGWLASNEIIILAIISVIALVFLVIWELTDKNPIVDLALFKSRNFTIGTISVSLAYMAYFGAIVLLPQLLQEVYGYTATWAGLALAPIGLLPVLLSAPVAKISDYVDIRWIVTCSFVFYAICFYWRAYTFEPDMGFMSVVWPQLVQGMAVACFFMPLTTLTLSGLPPEKFAAASSLSNFFRTLAGSIGTSITTTLWSDRESLHHSQLTESITNYNPESIDMYRELAAKGMSTEQSSTYIAQQITSQGLIIAANEIFWLCGGVFILLIVTVWFAKPPFGSAANKK
ncbi:DHA2 family efflux MFS transporter permease subunit [Moellerella wisconsensis]|nr:DHA2 family efflux MFS transporter permease subunit [Moellerella wisconsensis]KLN95738.1 multidrug resistance protein B [Moellerella wisconsensis]WJW82017.1 DHA2 family efflux MFS transporter permease subunit [Moellerella wisconsensis]